MQDEPKVFAWINAKGDRVITLDSAGSTSAWSKRNALALAEKVKRLAEQLPDEP